MSLIIRYVAKITAIIMVFVIIWGVADIVYVLYQRLKEPPFLLLEINDILATFGAFMAVLIAIEIYHNLVLYVQENHNSRLAVEIVLATALMAAARKVIVFDYNEMDYNYVYATGAVILALSIGYYYIVVVSQKHDK
ncbi:phosphate-starvation-inducible PsiE family protein [Cellvibrio sp. ARAG 10.3]|uniref:phosphate-starvation-inducible PsiE family protein n=1 Tax=Cellvibrio sp. ARAG 10.3 TaxID=3451358 RepID=UPI003F486FED